MLFRQKVPIRDLEKRDPNKPRISVFFEVFRRKFVNLVKVNMLYALGAIPTFILTMLVMGVFVNPVMNSLAGTIATVLGSGAEADADFNMYYGIIDLGLRSFLSLVVMVFLGLGPVSAGFQYIMRNYAREDHAWIMSDFWEQSRKNFRQAVCVWIIDLCVFCLMVFAFAFYINQRGIMALPAYIVFCAGLIFVMMHLYIYPLMVTFKLTVKQIYRNAFLLAFVEAPKNLLLVVIMALFHLVLPYIMIIYGWPVGYLLLFIIAEIFLTLSMTGFMTNFFIYPTLEKYIHEAEKTENDERNDL